MGKRVTLNPLTNARRTTSASGGASVDIINNLTSTRTDASLSANMGRVLDESVTSLDLQLQTEDGTPFYFDQKDGVFGFNTDEERGADTFFPFNNNKYYYEEREITTTGIMTFECGFKPKKVFLERFTSSSASSLNQINVYDAENGGKKIYYGGSSGFTSVSFPNTTTNAIRNISDEGVISYSADSSSYKYYKLTAIG